MRNEWEVIECEKQYIISSEDNTYDIAIVRNISERKDNKRNAFLIAAAPEMRESLEQMRNFMAWKYGEEDPFVTTADRALAKADGKEAPRNEVK